MTIFNKQSAIGEVRDQLSLDYAESKYLSRIGANLGLNRPPFGFSDAVWRALVKAIALQPKQIKTKFEEILTIVLGPKVTQCSAFAEDTAIGDRSAVLVDSSNLPQVGTMVIDEGLPTEETVRYVYIDRYTNRVYFEQPLAHNHVAVGVTWESGVISPVDATSTSLNVFNPSQFPTGSVYTVCVGRGTEYEQAGAINSVNIDSRQLTTSFTLNNGLSGISAAMCRVVNTISVSSQENTHYLLLKDADYLPEEGGHLQFALDKVFVATTGTTTSVTVPDVLTAGAYGGFWVRFVGNVTPALAGAVGYVEDNTTSTLMFSNTLDAAPAAGDEFVVLANVQYIRANAKDATVLLRKELPDLLTVAADSEITVFEPTTTVAVAQVQVKGAGWDVFQVDPRHVEILVPTKQVDNDLRSSSYIRATGQADHLPGSDHLTMAADAPFGSTSLQVVSTDGFPLIGVLTHNPTSIQHTYYVPNCWVATSGKAGDTTLTVTDTSQFPETGTLRINGANIPYTILDDVTFNVAALPNDIEVGSHVVEATTVRLVKPIEHSIAAGDTLRFYVNYDSGDVWNVPDVWPGPHVWDLTTPAHKKETVPENSLTTYVSGPTWLAVDRHTAATVLEVEDASCFPTGVPYNIQIGENSGNLETLAVQELSLRSRTYTTLSSDVAAGVTELPVAALAGPTPPLNTFPNGGPYRVLVDPFTPDQEVVEVTATATGPARLSLSQPTTKPHALGARVVLLSDLLRVSPPAFDEHRGRIKHADRFKFYAPLDTSIEPDKVRPMYTRVSLSLPGTDFSESEGEAVFNYGSGVRPATSRIVSISGNVIRLEDTSNFPTTGYPYTIYVDVGAGPLKEEVLHVEGNDVSTSELTVSHPPVFSHPTGRVVEFRCGPQENIRYNSRVGDDLLFSNFLEIEHTHQAVEYLAPTVGTNYPRKTGYDFPLRIPVDAEERIRYVVDLVRAAGIEVTFIDKR